MDKDAERCPLMADTEMLEESAQRIVAVEPEGRDRVHEGEGHRKHHHVAEKCVQALRQLDRRKRPPGRVVRGVDWPGACGRIGGEKTSKMVAAFR